MIIIDFKVDEIELLEDLKYELDKMDDISFVISMFMMPVRLFVNGYDLMEHSGDPWIEMPIMHLASNGILAIKKLNKLKKLTYDLPEASGSIALALKDDRDVNLQYVGFAKPVITIVKYDELLEAFQKFADKVREFLWERAPQMNNHLYWGPWLRGERD